MSLISVYGSDKSPPCGTLCVSDSGLLPLAKGILYFRVTFSVGSQDVPMQEVTYVFKYIKLSFKTGLYIAACSIQMPREEDFAGIRTVCHLQNFCLVGMQIVYHWLCFSSTYYIYF